MKPLVRKQPQGPLGNPGMLQNSSRTAEEEPSCRFHCIVKKTHAEDSFETQGVGEAAAASIVDVDRLINHNAFREITYHPWRCQRLRGDAVRQHGAIPRPGSSSGGGVCCRSLLSRRHVCSCSVGGPSAHRTLRHDRIPTRALSGLIRGRLPVLVIWGSDVPDRDDDRAVGRADL